MPLLTVGHGPQDRAALGARLTAAGVERLVDVRRFPGSRRNPQFNRDAVAAAVRGAGIEYRHAVDLGGRLADEPGEERFDCIRVPAFRSYAARMATAEWQAALADALAERRIFAAGLDVYEEEPKVNPKLLELENVVLAPHIGSASIETRDRMAALAAENLRAVLRGEEPPNPVDP